MKRRPPPFTKAVLHQAIINFCQTDLYLLVLSFLATFLLLLSTGFNPATMLLGSYDISGQHLAFYRFPYHHFPQEYWIDILGGTLGHSVYGMPFMYWLYTFGLLSLKNYFFIFHLTIMAALPYLCFKILAILLPPASLYAFPSKSSSGIFSPLVTFIIIFNFAALPAMGSKIIAGHSNIILGTVFFFLVLSWILAVWEKQYSLTHMLFSLLLLLQIFPYYNYHMLHTAICYGWPLGIILLGLYVRKKHRKEEAGSINSEGESKNRNKSIIAQKITKLKWILVKFWQDYRVSLLLFIGAFGVCFYQFYGMVTAFTGPDLARHLSGTPATFTYQTLYHSWYDWLNSLFVSKWWAKLYLPEIFINPSFHETNYPLGPLFFLTIGMLFIKTKSRKTILRPAYAAALFFLWWGIMMLFCLNLHPLSDLMLKIIPFAGSFRIPNRIFFIGLYGLQILGLGVWQYLFRDPSPPPHLRTEDSPPLAKPKLKMPFFPLRGWQKIGYGLLLILFILVLTRTISSAASEVITYFGLLLIIPLQLRAKQQTAAQDSSKLRYLAGLTLITLLSWQGFKDRTEHQYVAWKVVEHNILAGEKLKKATPGYFPLERFVLEDGFMFNYGLFTQIPSLNGYAVPLERFSRLFHEIVNEPYDALQYNFKPRSTMPHFALLKNLYALNFKVTTNRNEEHKMTELTIQRYPRTPNFWLPPEKPIVVSSYAALITSLEKAIKEDKIFSTLWLLQNDLNLYQQAKIKGQDFTHLKKATLHERSSQNLITLTLPLDYQRLALQAPVVLALNYASSLVALGSKSIPAGQDHKLANHEIEKFVLPTFPAYGPLLGVIIPPGIDTLEVQAVHPWPNWGWAVLALGIGCLGLAFYYSYGYCLRKTRQTKF